MSTHYTRDLAVVGAGALLTVLLRSLSRRYLEAHFAEWPSLPQRHQSRLLVEIAVIPSRLALITLTVPIVVRGFTPLETWTAHDTDACLLACAVLTGAYIVDLSVTRNNHGATLHHCMGPALLLWIRSSFSTFTSADALMCRLLMSFVFFGAVLSGTSTTTLNFIYRFRNIWFAASRVDGSSINGTVTSAARGHFWFAAFVPILLVSTIIGTFYSTLYVHSFMAECKAYFGRWIFLPWLWLLLECGMQWDWVRTFYGFESMYREDLNKEYAASNKLHNKKELTPTIGRPWWLPTWRFAAIRVLTTIWFATALGIMWRAVCA